ncbi:MAG: FKBP-type peptidyl-prolyl cis-trans isomerase [Flavobacteriales bacterium]|nr:FKBP-type peptidyl-prolyl cis-trans isomerase [Flavobacteriales bacterium]
MKYIGPLLIALFLLSACSKKRAEKQAEEDEQIILDYIADQGLTAVATGTGLYYVINDAGTGTQPVSSSDVTVAYKGYFTDGNVFDESTAAGITFNLQGVIQGWTEGIPKLKEGGDGILLIPSALGYGSNGSGSIPGNTVLIFDVELIDVL